MTFEEMMDSTPPMQQHALVKGYQAGFAAGAASRDAEIAELVAALEEVKHGLDQMFGDNVGMNGDGAYARCADFAGPIIKEALAKVRKP